MAGTRTRSTDFFGVMNMSWIEDDIAITFHTETPYYGSAPVDIIQSLRLDVLNDFLMERGFLLQSSAPQDVPSTTPIDQDTEEDTREEEENPLEAFLEELTEGGVEAIQKSMKKLEELILKRYNKKSDTSANPSKRDINDVLGKYLFPSPSDMGTVAMCFFNILPQKLPHPIQDMRAKQQGGDCCQSESNTRHVVN